MKLKNNSLTNAASPDTLHWNELLNNLDDRMTLIRQLQEHSPVGSAEKFMLKQTTDFVNEHPGCFKSELAEGHITVAAWIVNTGITHTLLMSHNRRGQWSPCSLHCDGTRDIFNLALTLPFSKLGIIVAPLSDAIFDVDLQWIPTSLAEPGHLHYQITMILEAVQPISMFNEYLGVHRTQWVSIDDITKHGYSPAVVRMAEKTKALKRSKL